MSFVAALIIALRVSMAGEGFRGFAAIVRREREARHGRPLTHAEQLEHRGAAFLLLAFACYVGLFVAMGLSARPPVPGLLVLAAVALTVVAVAFWVLAGNERDLGH